MLTAADSDSLSTLVQAGDSVLPFVALSSPPHPQLSPTPPLLCVCQTRCWKRIKVPQTIGSLLCLVCAGFILPLLTGCSHVWKGCVCAGAGLKARFVSLLSEKRGVLNSQDLFALPGLRRCSGGGSRDSFLPVFPVKRSLSVMKETGGFGRAPEWCLRYAFLPQIKTRYTSQFEFKSQGIAYSQPDR